MKDGDNLRAVCLVRAIVDDLWRLDGEDGGCCLLMEEEGRAWICWMEMRDEKEAGGKDEGGAIICSGRCV
jgi:hypothetical protein